MADQTYTTNPYSQRVAEIRSQVGDNPTAIAQAFAQDAVKTSQPLQETISGQSSAIDELSSLDKQLSEKYQGISNSAQQQTQNIGNMYGAAATMSAYDPNNPQEFIDRGPAQLDLNAFTQQYAPDTGLISPFAASKTADVQSSGQLGVFDLASQQRGSLERAIGTEAEAYGNIAKYENEQKAAEAERERQATLDEEKRQNDAFDRSVTLAKLTGASSIKNPINGETISISNGEQLNDLLKTREMLVEAGLDTTEIDSKLANFGTTPTEDTGKSNESKALEMVNDLVDGNYQAVSGGWKTPDWLARTGLVKGAGDAKTAWSGLGNLLALAKRGELKGSGTVSDFEAKMLQKAALAGLDPQFQTESEFKAGLEQLKTDLESGGAQDIREENTETPPPSGTVPGGFIIEKVE